MCVTHLCYPPCTRTRNSLSSSPAGLLAKQLYLPVSSNWDQRSVTRYENKYKRATIAACALPDTVNVMKVRFYCFYRKEKLIKFNIWDTGFHCSNPDLCWGYTEHLSSPQEAQTVCLWERASILQPGQRRCRDTRGLTLKLQDIINHNRYFRLYTRAFDVWRVWKRRKQTQFLYSQLNQNLKVENKTQSAFYSPSTLRLKWRLAWPAVLLATQV